MPPCRRKLIAIGRDQREPMGTMFRKACNKLSGAVAGVVGN
jgi:hypothetical protein